MKKVIVVIGTPRSGKSTQAKLLAEKLGYKYFSSNDVILEEIKNKTKIGVIMEKYLNSKTTEPDEYLIMLMKDAIINLKENGIVFVGYPNTINQAKVLDSFLFSRKIKSPIPIYLHAEPVAILERVGEKVISEDPTAFKRIMGTFESVDKMVADYYVNRIEFDTSKRGIDLVNEDIKNAIKERS